MRYGAKFLLAVLVIAAQPVVAQEAGQFLYGTINTAGGEAFTGPLRWDDEEILWTDHFNAEKTRNEYVSLLAPEDVEFLETRGPSSIRRLGDLFDLFSRENRFSDFRQPHSFVCRFGDIARLVPKGEKVSVVLRNGETLLLSDNSNDVGSGTNLQVFDKESGLKKLRWRDVASVSFAAAPKDAATPWGAPIFGIVETQGATLSGYVQWDHDERVGSDMLDGELDGEDVSIAFGDISAIEKTASGSKVILKTGETFIVTGSNDVNDENRGLYIELANGARADMSWESFRRIEFTQPQRSSPSYGDFRPPRKLAGSVTLRDDQRIAGVFAFDLDESWDIEMLDGREASTGISVPFSFVSRLSVEDVDSTRVFFRDGSQMLLSHDQDVSERNDGLVIFGEENKPRYVRWLDVMAIELHGG